ncbi:MAG: DPP IV N-terminal domain-containing protein [Marinifilaceae bacterium]|jgi:dipeptidyl-peptidase-4|nr:DPP IV N-terminal domain-containing protein [Marinifilaceae bacterium]
MKNLIKLLLIICVFFSGTNLKAQTKLLSMEDAILGQWRQFYPKSIYHQNWIPKSNSYTYYKNQALYKVDIDKKFKETKILSVDQLNKALKELKLNKINSIPSHQWIDANTLKFEIMNKLFYYNILNHSIEFSMNLNPNGANNHFAKSTKAMAYTVDNNLFITNAKGDEIQVSNDKDKNLVNGQSVSRNEYGINGGIFWSDNGKLLAYYRKDESKVSTFPLLDITSRTGSLEEIKYPMAGMNSEKVELKIYNTETTKTVNVNVTDFDDDRYLTNISWDANNKYIYIQVLNRASSHMKLNKYDANNGEFVKTILEEKSNTWVEPQHKLIFLGDKDNSFIYQTNNRHGHNHLYLYNGEGEFKKQLTKGAWDVTEVLGFDNSKRYLFYISTEKSPMERHAYRLNLKTAKANCLTAKEGYHNVKVSSTGKYIIDNYSSLNVPREILIANYKGLKVKNLLTAKNKLKDYNLGEIKLGKIKSADKKTDLYYRLVTPANLDPNKKYPVVVYVYGGPHAQLVTNRYLGGARLWEEYMAQRGYVVFTLDNRGSANRGKEFETVIHRNCGQAEMQDQMKGVEFLKSLPYVDHNRIGVHGWSYGGFMTISLITNYPETFKVAVAGGPVIDWKWYEIMYGERYMDTPQENAEGYAKTSLINKAKDLKGKLLICQGAIDNTVLWQHSLSFIRECIKNNVQVDYFPYPRAEHNVRGKDRIHLKQKVSNYFDDYLK